MPNNQLVRMPQELQGVQAAGAHDFDQMYRLAQIAQASGLFEDVTDVAQAFVKIAKGQELGLPPMSAMGAFDIIRKRLFIKPWIIAAKINSCGYGSYRVLVQGNDICTISFARKYAAEGWVTLPPVSYTYAEAKAQGLAGHPKESQHWKASPANMLYQRCMGRGGAQYFPELLAGLTLPPDAVPLSDEQHADNIDALFGGKPPAMIRESPFLDMVARQAGQLGVKEEPVAELQPLTTAEMRDVINRHHRAHGHDDAWIDRYWTKMCRRFKLPMGAWPSELQHEALMEEVQAYYAKQDNVAARAVQMAVDMEKPVVPDMTAPATREEDTEASVNWRKDLYDMLSYVPEGELKASMTTALADPEYSEEEGVALEKKVRTWLETQETPQEVLL